MKHREHLVCFPQVPRGQVFASAQVYPGQTCKATVEAHLAGLPTSPELGFVPVFELVPGTRHYMLENTNPGRTKLKVPLSQRKMMPLQTGRFETPSPQVRE